MRPAITCHARYARIEDCLVDASEPSRAFRDERRQRQWLAGRVLARKVIGEVLGFAPDQSIEIVSRDSRNLGTAPQMWVGGRLVAGNLSIAHSDRGVLVAYCPEPAARVGVDLCEGVPNSAGFRRLWFTPAEQAWIERDPDAAALIWSVKEAVFKAISAGRAWTPRDVEVAKRADGRIVCQYQGALVEPLTLTIRPLDGQVAAIGCLADDAGVRLHVARQSSFVNNSPVVPCS